MSCILSFKSYALAETVDPEPDLEMKHNLTSL